MAREMNDAGVDLTAQRWAWWGVTTGIALIAASQWLDRPRVEYLVPLVIATAAGAWLAFRVERAPRRWAIASSVFLALSAVLALPAQYTLYQIEHHWDAWRAESARTGLNTIRATLDNALANARGEAERALDAPADRAQAFQYLADVAPTNPWGGVVLYQTDSVFAWAGDVRIAVDRARDSVAAWRTPFYLTVTRTVSRGDRRATAAVLVDAEPPADRLAPSLTAHEAQRAGLSDFVFTAPSRPMLPGVLQYSAAQQPLFDVYAQPLEQGVAALKVTEVARVRAGLVFVLALALFIVAIWRGTQGVPGRLLALAVALACTALVPLNEFSNLTRLFDPAVYHAPIGGQLSANAGALLTTGAVVILGLLVIFGRRPRPVPPAVAGGVVLAIAGLGPFLLRDLASGIQIPISGVDSALWLIWEVPLFLAAVCVLLAGAAAGGSVLGRQRGVAPWLAPALAATAALLAPPVWQAPGQWPWWYIVLWIVAIALLALSRQTRYVVLNAATVAALGAITLVWGRAAKGRVELAQRDVTSLQQVDSFAVSLARRFGDALSEDTVRHTRAGLLAQYVSSELSQASYPVVLTSWDSSAAAPLATFATASIPAPLDTVRFVARLAARAGRVTLRTIAGDTAVEIIMAAPSPSGGVTAAVIAPKSRLFQEDPFARLIGLDLDTGGGGEPPYTLRLLAPSIAPPVGGVWRREGTTLHGDWSVHPGPRAIAAHAEVELRPLEALLQRGLLIALLDLSIVGLLWLVSVIADGGVGRWVRVRRRGWTRSYRARLSVALLGFFVVPALAFAVWSYRQLATDATQSRALVVSEALRQVPLTGNSGTWLSSAGVRLDAPVFVYQSGELVRSSDSLYSTLAPIGRYLDPAVEQPLGLGTEEQATHEETVGVSRTLFGYRAITAPETGEGPVIVAVPARADEQLLENRRRDLGVLVLFATVVGALGAVWLSGVAARQLERPIRTLRGAALSIAQGVRVPPLGSEPTVEFSPVFSAFRRMATDLDASRSALEEAQRRTSAVLRNVASGVVAVDVGGAVSLANPRAESLLGHPIRSGAPFSGQLPARLSELVQRFLSSSRDELDFELEVDDRQLRGVLTRLASGGGGAVVTIDDVTELARAQRVLAWGEMARQVAHEIKNPLTPIRLGVQHLKRAHADSRVDFDRVLEQNVDRILGEIDRLDEIARAFSRYGSAPEERPAPAPVDVVNIAREVIALEQLGMGQAARTSGPRWEFDEPGQPALAIARADELKEVLLNLLENARHAAATAVRVRVQRDATLSGSAAVAIVVQDDGHGIPADVLPRVFEPHFSTRTSGSGLGLAISRRLVDGWGGTIELQSRAGAGTTVTVMLKRV